MKQVSLKIYLSVFCMLMILIISPRKPQEIFINLKEDSIKETVLKKYQDIKKEMNQGLVQTYLDRRPMSDYMIRELKVRLQSENFCEKAEVIAIQNKIFVTIEKQKPLFTLNYNDKERVYGTAWKPLVEDKINEDSKKLGYLKVRGKAKRMKPLNLKKIYFQYSQFKEKYNALYFDQDSLQFIANQGQHTLILGENKSWKHPLNQIENHFEQDAVLIIDMNHIDKIFVKEAKYF
jgi:hypothetical protein